MKRTLFLLIVAIGIVAISTGCSSGDTQVLEDKISQLEQQLNSQNASSSNNTTASSNTSSQNDATNAATSSAPVQITIHSKPIPILTQLNCLKK
ncbi:MAG: hypothetical protein ACLSCV_07235 [Acutalibacteraceae bacterium]